MIHPTVIIDPSAHIANNVSIGAYSIIGPGVKIGEHTVIGAHVQLVKNVHIGRHNQISAYSVLGGDPAHRMHQPEDETYLMVGDHNVIHEYAVFHRGAKVCGGITRIGDHNYMMCYVHIGHDSQVMNHTTFVNNVNIAGGVVIEDYAYMGAYSFCFQKTRVGSSAMLTPRMMVARNILPYMIVKEDQVCGINRIGIQRRGCSDDQIAQIKSLYKLICREKLLLTEVKDKLLAMDDALSSEFLTFMNHGTFLRK
ncbi:acyl-ACP--UDP-N-acetylglucosamine O-acyltransferase [Gammaproteobacteria bacterium]|nr:acyl-ACP--UDP-N-acetylglucosamine O-acyltransferase [Gammaproteobacteria bacterium]